jgi:hypothetical protein
MAFNPHLVLPPISEIVFIEEAFIYSKLEIRQLDFAPIDLKVGYYSLTDAVILAANAESMQVKVAPAESDLYGIVEIGEGRIAAD